MNPDQTKYELLTATLLVGLPEDVRDEIVADVIRLLADRFPHLSDEESRRLGRHAVKWLVWRHHKRARTEKAHLARYANANASRWSENEAVAPAEVQEAKRELGASLHEAMRRSLTPQEQIVVLRRFVQDASAQSVADELKITTQQVYYLSRRSLEILRAQLSGLEDLFQ